MRNKYYKYPHYPSNDTRVINYIPGEIVYDSTGDVYEITEELEGIEFAKVRLVKSVLKPEYRVDDGGLNEFQFNRLFVVLTDKEINRKLSALWE